MSQQSDCEYTKSSPVLSNQAVRHMEAATDSSRNAVHAPARSNPIAIRRNAPTAADASDDDEGESDGLSVRSRASNPLDSGTTSISLPSRFLRAPLLGSVPSAEYFISSQAMLPPAITQLSGVESVESSSISRGTGTVAYGSLRESNMKGRFLDGPSSYRDRRTGSIRQLQHRVRFQEPSIEAATHGTPQFLSIGERLMQGRKRQDASPASKDEQHQPSSSLATMLEAATIEDVSQVAGHEVAMGAQSILELDACETFYDNENEVIERSDLSTSLTGLEVLQSLRTSNTALLQRSTTERNPEAGNLQELPRDCLGHNALLSRSFSDPTPNFKRAMPRTSIMYPERSDASPVRNTSPVGLTSAALAANRGGHNDYVISLSGGRSFPIESVDSSTGAPAAEGPISLASTAATFSHIYGEPVVPAHVSDPSMEDTNPDIEGAFVMDLE